MQFHQRITASLDDGAESKYNKKAYAQSSRPHVRPGVNFYEKERSIMEKKPARAIALLPIGVFLVLYLGLGCLFEYGLKIKMGFYNIPIVVAFLVAILVACL